MANNYSTHQHKDLYKSKTEREPSTDIEKFKKENIELQHKFEILEKNLQEHKKDSTQKHNDLLAAISQLTKRIESNYGQQLDNSNKSDDNRNDTIKKTISEEKQKLNDLDLRFQLHENSTTDGHLIWKINDFENRTNDAIIGKVRALHSAPCFTGKYGYKFCLRLYLHGDGMGRSTHLSLFLVIMKSEYDDIQQWPFQQKIKFKLINQNDRSKDHVEQMFPSKDSSSFQKPKKDMNIASGCPLFIPLDRLQPEGFLKNGNLFVEVKIE